MHLGNHILVEYHECTIESLSSIDRVREILIASVEVAGATLVQSFFHQFSPQGVSGICVVAESHFALHTWPEHAYAAVDIFSCGNMDFDAAIDFIATELGSGSWFAGTVERGKLEAPGYPAIINLPGMANRKH